MKDLMKEAADAVVEAANRRPIPRALRTEEHEKRS